MSQGFENLLNSIRQQGDDYCTKVLDQAENAGQLLKEKLIQEAKVRLENREVRYRNEAKFLGEQEFTKYQMNMKQEINSLKLSLIDKLLEECKNYYKTLSKENFLKLIKQALDDNNGSHPRIEVESKYYDFIREQLGQDYQIVENQDMDSGFVLNYAQYDVNYEIDKLFLYHNQELTKIAMKLLFGDTDDENT